MRAVSRAALEASSCPVPVAIFVTKRVAPENDVSPLKIVSKAPVVAGKSIE